CRLRLLKSTPTPLCPYTTLVRSAEILAAGRKSRRFVPGGVHRADQGHRPLRPGAGGAVFHLRRAHDRGGDPAFSAGQQRGAGQPDRTSTRLNSSLVSLSYAVFTV